MTQDKHWGGTGDKRDVLKFPCACRLGNVPAFPIFLKTEYLHPSTKEGCRAADRAEYALTDLETRRDP
jgi:hypothetical protein